LSGSLGFDSIFSFDNRSGFFNVLLEDLSALIWGFFFLQKRLWPSLVSLSVVKTTVGLNSSVDTDVILLVFTLVPVFLLGIFDIFIASGFPGLLVGDGFFDNFAGGGFLFIGIFWVLFWWCLLGFFFLFCWLWVSLGKRGNSFSHMRVLSGVALELVFDWHWGVVNESSISHDFSSNSDSVLLVFALLVVFLLGGSDVGVALLFESSLFGDSVEDNLQGSGFLTV